MKKLIYYSIILISFNYSFTQDYFLENFGPYNENIQSPEEFLGYEIGDQHTRHDLILAYFKYLSSISERADLINYGKSYEGRALTLLSISSEENLKNLDEIKTEHLKSTIPGSIKAIDENLPVIVNLGYGIHGNEPSSSEAALLTAYTLIASKNKKIVQLVTNSVVFVDPTLNPDGRDRHSQWANQYKSINLVADSNDAEHNESWPRGRTNHYWFDLNRDWLLAIHPESKGKLNWLHEWYPNVVVDAHEMGTNSNYFFDPMKPSASVKPLIPKENVDLY
ncbi:MAG: zinc carboxypeptidase, partial [Flavobacteriaceae bacterium]|nr:zinc carboxypeptidase [Flavobacteriaceae bacterium]